MKIDLTKYEKSPKKKSFDLDVNMSSPFSKRFSDKQKEDFYREFSTLITAGVDFNQALQILTDQQKKITK